jgi:excisionase family DNA binding protein
VDHPRGVARVPFEGAGMTAMAVSLQEAAKMLSVSIWTLKKLVKEKNLRSVRIGRRVVIQVSELERFLSGKANG